MRTQTRSNRALAIPRDMQLENHQQKCRCDFSRKCALQRIRYGAKRKTKEKKMCVTLMKH